MANRLAEREADMSDSKANSPGEEALVDMVADLGIAVASTEAEEKGPEVVDPHNLGTAAPAETAPAPCPPNHIYVLDPVAASRRINTVGIRSRSDTQTRLRDLLIEHEHLTRPYPLRGYPRDMQRCWKELRATFPNFGEVLDLLEKRHALAKLRRATPVFFTPLLLLGDPGVGKTAFTTALAGKLGLFHGEIPMAGLTEAFTISGLDVGWSSGNPGRVFEYVSAARHANPLLLLDEFDKCGRSGSGGDPYAPFHVLLERHSAERFEDVAIRLPANFSWINWIATANDPFAIPPSLLSRFRKVVVRKPTRDEMREVIRSIYANKRKSVTNGDRFVAELSESVVALLQEHTPRTVGLILEDAMGNAAKRVSHKKNLHLSTEDIAIPFTDVKKQFGFCP